MHKIEVYSGCAAYYIFFAQVLVFAILQMGPSGDDIILDIAVMKDHRYVKNGLKQLRTPSIAED